jgi:hypothetical protein
MGCISRGLLDEWLVWFCSIYCVKRNPVVLFLASSSRRRAGRAGIVVPAEKG